MPALGRLSAVLLMAACGAPPRAPEPWTSLLPQPQSVTPGRGTFVLGSDATIGAPPGLEGIGEQLAAALRASTGYALPVRPPPQAITLELDPSVSGDEGYQLTVGSNGVRIQAAQPAGLFYGTQTLLQLLPAELEGSARQRGPFAISQGTLRDAPRFPWRGLMIDVARHFFTPGELRRYVDAMARYKLNRLHLHLTDDQGWRLEITSRPTLTQVGAATEVGGGPGGFYTQGDYAALVQYAAERFVTVVPEVDLPGHTGAALSSLPELNCSGVAPPLYTGTMVGLSSLCPGPASDQFIADVIREVAAITPGPFLHVGGDEAKMTAPADYLAFEATARAAVADAGKQLVGWEELARADAGAGEVVQHWADPSLAAAATGNGARVILSPAQRVYLDMQYAQDTPKGVGTFWAGFVPVSLSYDWDPAAWLMGVPESAVLGVEAPAWTETIADTSALDEMVFPRLLGVAELGWSPASARDLKDYLRRLGAHGPRLRAQGLGFYASPQVRWAQ